MNHHVTAFLLRLLGLLLTLLRGKDGLRRQRAPRSAFSAADFAPLAPRAEGKKILWPAAIALVALAGMGDAWAQTLPCGIPSPAGPQIAFNQVNIQSANDIPNGATIATVTQTYSVICPGMSTPTTPSTRGYYFSFFSQTAAGWGTNTADPLIWKTPVAGVGLRITNLADGTVLQYCSTSYSITPNCLFAKNFTTDLPFAQFTYTFTLQFELVKIGSIPTGGSLAGPFIWLSSRGMGCTTTGTGCYAAANASSFAPGVAVLPSTCTVKTPSLYVTLPEINVSELNATNKTAGEQPFQIDLACNGSATLKNVYINLTDAANPNNTSNLLTLESGSGHASGVSLQILRSGVTTPITFGPDRAAAGTPGQWTAGALATTAKNISIPLSARYIATGPVKPGNVKATATFTLYYQ